MASTTTAAPKVAANPAPPKVVDKKKVGLAKEDKKKKKKIALKKSVQTFGKKKTALAVAWMKQGNGKIRVNGRPIELIEPEALRYKVFEPILLLGKKRFANLDIKIRATGGGGTAQIYAIRQAISRAIVAFHQKYTDEVQKREIKDILVSYDRTLLSIDARVREPKKFGGPGARGRYQKSYR